MKSFDFLVLYFILAHLGGLFLGMYLQEKISKYKSARRQATLIKKANSFIVRHALENIGVAFGD